jgi:hypothetical protein
MYIPHVYFQVYDKICRTYELHKLRCTYTCTIFSTHVASSTALSTPQWLRSAVVRYPTEAGGGPRARALERTSPRALASAAVVMWLRMPSCTKKRR